MAKNLKKDVIIENEKLQNDVVVRNEIIQALYRRSLLAGLNGEVDTNTLNRDYDTQFGYPDIVNKLMYKKLFDRNAIANRVVSIYPNECWLSEPEIYDQDQLSTSDFEKKLERTFELFECYGVLTLADILSGIGSYGLILFGVSDGKDLSEPIDCVEYLPETLKQGKYQLIYLRAFAHSQIEVSQIETNTSNPRYGQPVLYRIQFNDPDNCQDDTGMVDMRTLDVHWTRVLHLADNRQTSTVFGMPRLQLVYNNVLDIRKIAGSSGEMFYKGAYPGFSVEAVDDVTSGVQLDLDSMKKQIAAYENGLQRWFGLTNAHVNSLSPQVQSPREHIDINIELIAIALSCPKRIFCGSERGDLASSQDVAEWNKTLMTRMKRYLTPFVLKPFITRLIQIGELPAPKDGIFFVKWDDLNAGTDQQKIENANNKLNLIGSYLSNNIETIICPKDFLMMFLNMSDKEADSILQNSQAARAKAISEDNSEQIDNLSVLNFGLK
ncbi:MAG: DUF1073 domain-containing protein [Planctomycetaceae bacterium]|jgi:hypothetical protein|nr:DUF1073 domain-containing protein [Planctomycetaceae bacterium]